MARTGLDLDLGVRSQVYRLDMGTTVVEQARQHQTQQRRHARWTVADVAREAGISPDTVRYYERAGLLAAAGRSAAGYRQFDAGSLDRLRFIQGAQRLGLRLREIRDLLAVRDTGVCPCESAETLLRRRVAEIEREIARLTTVRGDLEQMLTGLPGPGCPDPEPGTWCPVVPEFTESTGSTRSTERDKGGECSC